MLHTREALVKRPFDPFDPFDPFALTITGNPPATRQRFAWGDRQARLAPVDVIARFGPLRPFRRLCDYVADE